MILGIDLGTTNSLAAVWRGGQVELIPNHFGDFLTPSAVGLSDEEMAELENVLEQEQCTYALARLRWAKSSYKGDWYAVEQMTPNQISQVIKEIQSAYHKEEFYDRMNIYSAQINDMVPMLMWKSYHLYMNHKDSFANVY